MKATYGHEIKSDEDKFLKLAFNAVSALTSNPAGGTDIVDILPLRAFNRLQTRYPVIIVERIVCYVPSWFPGGGFKRRAEEGRKLQQALLELPYLDLKIRMVIYSLFHRTRSTNQPPQKSGQEDFEHGMLPRLIEDYVMDGENDPHRELDIQSVAAVMYAGTLCRMHSERLF